MSGNGDIMMCSCKKKNGEPCTMRAKYYHAANEEYYCTRHNKLTSADIARIERKVLCHYGRDGLPLSDPMGAPLEPDPIGEAFIIKYLNGYINMRYGTPLMDRDEAGVFMSNLSGYGPNFNRRTLAMCLRESLEYMISRPDAYECKRGVGLHNLRLMEVVYSDFYGHYIAVMRVFNNVENDTVIIID